MSGDLAKASALVKDRGNHGKALAPPRSVHVILVLLSEVARPRPREECHGRTTSIPLVAHGVARSRICNDVVGGGGSGGAGGGVLVEELRSFPSIDGVVGTIGPSDMGRVRCMCIVVSPRIPVRGVCVPSDH